VWTVFALRGPLVFWIDTALEAIVFGVLFGVGLWALGSAKLPRLVAFFSIAFLVTFFDFELTTSNALGDEKLALVSMLRHLSCCYWLSRQALAGSTAPQGGGCA